FMLCFAALGAGNGATFQLVPLRWPANTAVAGSMIGEIGALGGSILPNLLGQSKQHTGSYATGIMIYAGFALIILIVMRFISRGWIGAWVGPGGRVLNPEKMREDATRVPTNPSHLAHVSCRARSCCCQRPCRQVNE